MNDEHCHSVVYKYVCVHVDIYKLSDFRDSKSCVLSLERYEQVEYFHSFFVVNDDNNYNKTVKKNVKNSNNKNKFV